MTEEKLLHTDEESQIEEITLDSPGGLLQFIDHIEEQYADFLLVKDSLRIVPSAQSLIFSAKDAHQRLVEKIKEAFNEFDLGHPVTTDHAILMQEIYNEFVDAVAELEVASISFLAEAALESIVVEPVEQAKKATLGDIFPARELAKDSIVTEKLLKSPRYQAMIQEYFPSPFAFEAALWRIIKRVEEPSQLDRLLGVRHGSVFKEILKGMTVGEIAYFSSQPGEHIREALLEMEKEDGLQYDYRVFVAWMDEFHYMTRLIEPRPDTPFEDLLAMFELERLSY